MKKLFGVLLVASLLLASSRSANAATTFSGAFLVLEGYIGGNIRFTVDGGTVDFQSTLFQAFATDAVFEPVLLVQNKVIPFDYGDGVPGRFELGDFFGPIPGFDYTPICGWEYLVFDPGFALPVYLDGVRFAGSFTAFPGLENLLRAKEGTVALRLNGDVIGLEQPVFSAVVVEWIPPITQHFEAEISGESQVPPTVSSHRARATFSLTGDCLTYHLAWAPGLDWIAGGVFGPAGAHSTSTNRLADMSEPMRVSFFASSEGLHEIIYHGAVSLGDEEVRQLKLGKLYVNLITDEYPDGEIRGQILPVTKEDRKLNRK